MSPFAERTESSISIEPWETTLTCPPWERLEFAARVAFWATNDFSLYIYSEAPDCAPEAFTSPLAKTERARISAVPPDVVPVAKMSLLAASATASASRITLPPAPLKLLASSNPY